MRRILIQIFAVLVLNILAACTTVENNSDIDESTPEKDLLVNVDWLTGSWQNTTKESSMIESWYRLDDSTMAGKTFFIEGKDTVSKESIKLIQRKNEVFYMVEVNTQNGGKPVPFKLTSWSTDSLVFMNSKHDFPQKISYLKISIDSIVAEISGNIKGNMHPKNFRWED